MQSTPIELKQECRQYNDREIWNRTLGVEFISQCSQLIECGLTVSYVEQAFDGAELLSINIHLEGAGARNHVKQELANASELL